MPMSPPAGPTTSRAVTVGLAMLVGVVAVIGLAVVAVVLLLVLAGH